MKDWIDAAIDVATLRKKKLSEHPDLPKPKVIGKKKKTWQSKEKIQDHQRREGRNPHEPSRVAGQLSPKPSGHPRPR